MTKNYKHLLAPIKVGNHVFKNHIVMTPTTPATMQGKEYYPAESVVAHYIRRAKNGAALITVNGVNLFFDEEHKPAALKDIFSWDIEDTNQHYMAQLVEGIHKYGSLCTMQIQQIYDDSTYDWAEGAPAFGAAGINEDTGFVRKSVPVEIIHSTTEELVRKCVILKNIGFDGLYLHMSYQQTMLGRSLSRVTNLRHDEYGGDTWENRTRLLKETCSAIKKACGQDFIIEAHITGEERDMVTGELIPGGWSLDDSAHLVDDMEGLIDILHIRGWHIDEQHPISVTPDVPPYLYLAEEVKNRCHTDKVKILSVSNYHDPEMMDKIVAEGKVDFIGMARPLIADPDFILKLYEDRAEDIVPCIRCNKCLNGASSGRTPSETCSVNPLWGFEHRAKNFIEPATASRKVAVVGAGPAGMQAAKYCTLRGHKVTLFEKTDRLGGQLIIGDYASNKWPLKGLKDYLAGQMDKLGVDVRLNCAPTPEELDAEGFEVIICGVGSVPRIPNIPGLAEKGYMSALESYGREAELGQNVVIIGGGENGVETGLHLARDCGKTVTVLGRNALLGKDMTPMHYRTLVEVAVEQQEGLTCITSAPVKEVTAEGVVYTKDGQDLVAPCDSVLVSVGIQACADTALSFAMCDGRVILVGDANGCNCVQEAMRDGYFAAMQI